MICEGLVFCCNYVFILFCVGGRKLQNNSSHLCGNLEIEMGQITDIHSHSISPEIDFIKLVFKKYGKGGFLTFEGFEHFLTSIKLYSADVQNHTTASHSDVEASEFDKMPTSDVHHPKVIDNAKSVLKHAKHSSSQVGKEKEQKDMIQFDKVHDSDC